MTFSKKIMVVSFLTLTLSCTKSKQDADLGPRIPENTQSITEENDMCICTKEFRPVCADSGKTYPNSCQAKCDGVENFKEGSC